MLGFSFGNIGIEISFPC